MTNNLQIESYMQAMNSTPTQQQYAQTQTQPMPTQPMQPMDVLAARMVHKIAKSGSAERTPLNVGLAEIERRLAEVAATLSGTHDRMHGVNLNSALGSPQMAPVAIPPDHTFAVVDRLFGLLNSVEATAAKISQSI